jgi:predicted Zn-dependent protease
MVYKFALVADDEGGPTHEPLSLPGGHLVVSATLIRAAADEAELAGMLAHAMAHVTLPGPQGDKIPLIFMGGWNGLGSGSNASVVPMSFRKTQQDNETRADALAVTAMSAAGYDPEALAGYLARVQPPSERAPKIFAVLPDRDARVAAIRQTITGAPARTYPALDSDVFNRIQEQLPVVEARPRPTLRRQN